MLIPYLNIINQRLKSIFKMGAPSLKLTLISWLSTIPFNSGYVHITISGLNKYMKYVAPNV